MRLVFAGTPPFAERVLAAVLEAGHSVALVLTQPDRPAGRGMRRLPSAVKSLALRRGLALLQPVSLREGGAVERLRDAAPDALVVAAYGLLLPRAVLDIPARGAFNVHASLLPRWRGAAPIQRALLAGDSRTGISIMKMDAGLDTGPVLAQREVAIEADDDAQTLHDKLAALGAEMLVAALAEVSSGPVPLVAQSRVGVTYAPRIDKRELQLDWRESASQLERAVRAFRPSPGAYSVLRNESIKLWRARIVEGTGAPGTVIGVGGEGLTIACGAGSALLATELQRSGAKRLHAAAFLRGFPIAAGERFDLPPAGGG